jgi:hypothetical protein
MAAMASISLDPASYIKSSMSPWSMEEPAWKDWKGCLSSCLFLLIYIIGFDGCD